MRRVLVSPKPLLAVLVALVALLAGQAGASPQPESGRAAAEEGRYDPDRILVAFEPGTPGQSRAEAHRTQGGRVENRFEHLNLDVVRVRQGEDPPEVAQRYERNPNVAYAQPNWEVQLDSVPNDVLFGNLWGLHNDRSLLHGTPDADIDAPEGWLSFPDDDPFPSSGGVRVGVLDTGIDRSHVDLLGKTTTCATAVSLTGTVTEGTCSDDNSHGTHVAGTVAAIANNTVGVAGVAPNADLAVFKAFNAAGIGFTDDIIAGIRWLHTTGGAKIISMSFGGDFDDAENAALNDAASAGTLLIASAGNSGSSKLNWPAAHPDVVSVAATDKYDKQASFSTYNDDVEVAAPGVEIWSTTSGNSYAPLNGTSMAAPHASGVAAMIWWKNSGWSASQVRDQLTRTVDDLGDPGRDVKFGYGRVNLEKALGGTSPPPPADPGAIGGMVTDGNAGISGAKVDCGTGGKATTATDGT